MPFLTLPADYPDRMSTASPRSDRPTGSESPSAPPYSPITPVLPSAVLAPVSVSHSEESQGVAVERPLPIPILESDNTDAIALRSAISVLQIQRQQAVRDLRTLEQQKHLATSDLEKFAAELASGVAEKAPKDDLLDLWSAEHSHGQRNTDGNGLKVQGDSAYGPFPKPQNIVRCPPINWAKYHVVGEALDKLHEEQISHPTPGEPQKDIDLVRSPEYMIAAPYRPWTDKVPGPSMGTKGEGCKPP